MTDNIRERQLDFQARAAELQGRIGLGMVSAGTSNDWRGAYCIVDFDTLDELLSGRERDRQQIARLTEALRFYADPVSYENETPRHVRPVITDQGARARAVLADEEDAP